MDASLGPPGHCRSNESPGSLPGLQPFRSGRKCHRQVKRPDRVPRHQPDGLPGPPSQARQQQAHARSQVYQQAHIRPPLVQALLVRRLHLQRPPPLGYGGHVELQGGGAAGQDGPCRAEGPPAPHQRSHCVQCSLGTHPSPHRAAAQAQRQGPSPAAHPRPATLRSRAEQPDIAPHPDLPPDGCARRPDRALSPGPAISPGPEFWRGSVLMQA